MDSQLCWPFFVVVAAASIHVTGMVFFAWFAAAVVASQKKSIKATRQAQLTTRVARKRILERL